MEAVITMNMGGDLKRRVCDTRIRDNNVFRSEYQSGSGQLLAEDRDPGRGDSVSEGGGQEAGVGHHGGAPVRVLEVVADALEVPVALRLTARVAQVGGAVVADHGLCRVDFSDQILDSARVQCVGLRKFSIILC